MSYGAFSMSVNGEPTRVRMNLYRKIWFDTSGHTGDLLTARLAERRFPETSFARKSFCRTLNRPPVYTFVQCACRRAAIKLIGIDVLRHASKICVISNRVRVWTFLNMDTVRIRKVRNSRYRRFDLIVVFVPLNAILKK